MTFPQVVTPECFNRGSTMITTTLSQAEWVGGPVRNSPGFPLQPEADPSEALWRKKHAGMTDSWHCYRPPPRSKLRGIDSKEIKKKTEKGEKP